MIADFTRDRVQATLAPDVLATLMKDPGEMGKTLADDASMSEPKYK
jgi:hypothetical protein